MDFGGSPIVRLGIPRAIDVAEARPPRLRSLAEVMEWLPLVDADGHPIEWSHRTGAYLADLLWRIAQGRVTA